MSDEKILEAGFDHPCRQTCSGWEQGRARGKYDTQPIIRALAEEIDQLKLSRKDHEDDWKRIQDAEREVDALKTKLEKAQDGEQFYRREWENCCERYDYARSEVAELDAEKKRLCSEVEDLMRMDYWQERHNIIKGELTAAQAEIKRLTETLQKVIDRTLPTAD